MKAFLLSLLLLIVPCSLPAQISWSNIKSSASALYNKSQYKVPVTGRKFTNLIPNDMLKADDTTAGVNARYYRHGSNDPVVTKVVENVDYMWEMKSPVAEIKVEDFREARFDTWIHAKEDGKYTLKFITGGGSLLAYNNEWAGAPIVIQPSNRGGVVTANIEIRKGNPYHLCVIYSRGIGDAACRIEIETPESDASARQMAGSQESRCSDSGGRNRPQYRHRRP